MARLLRNFFNKDTTLNEVQGGFYFKNIFDKDRTGNP